jgi:hypothetical protein
LVEINKIIASHKKVVFQARHEYIKPNINALVEKWMPCDTFWTPRVLRFEYMIRLKGNEEYHLERIEIYIFLSLNPYENL